MTVYFRYGVTNEIKFTRTELFLYIRMYIHVLIVLCKKCYAFLRYPINFVINSSETHSCLIQ